VTAGWQDVPLVGEQVVLEPLALDHADALAETVRDPAVWRWIPRVPPRSRADMAGYIAERLGERAAGSGLPYAVRSIATGDIVGSTALYEIDSRQQRAVVGWTWFAPSAWGSGSNDESKFLLLRLAFETLGVARIEIRTDNRNEPAQRALRRMGFVYEGALRSHTVRPDGSRRDTLVFSVLAAEWPAAAARLRASPTRPPTRSGGCRGTGEL
jgi:RimJ/RimL family protein N-acetyltransferase